jgi:putative transposase
VLLAKSVGASRFVYNWGLAESQHQYELTGKRPRLGELKTQLVGLKQGECPWLYEVSAHIGQSALKDLNVAFGRFFKGLKGAGPKSGFPRFKRKGERDSARLYEVVLEERHIRLPMIGRVRLKETRSQRGFDGRILSATIRRRADRWFVSLCVERERDVMLGRAGTKPADIVGVDLGLTNAAVIHDGARTRVVEPQRALRKNLAKLRRLDRKLARKQRGSRNREKAKLRRQRLHYKVGLLSPSRLPAPALEHTGENQVGDRARGPACQGYAAKPLARPIDRRRWLGRAPPPARLQERVVRLHPHPRRSLLPLLEALLGLRGNQGRARP